MNSMMSMPGWRCSMIAVSALALLSGCVTGDHAPLRIAENDSQTMRPAFQESASMRGDVAASDGVVTETRYLPYEKNALYKLRAAVGSSSTIELQPGQSVLLRHEGHSGHPLDATVQRLTPKGDPETKTFRVYLLLPNETPLMIGMSVEANIIVQEAKDVVLVPAEAVVDDMVQVAENGQVVRKRVDVGIRGSGLVELQSSVEAGELVLSPFRQDLDDGARIRLRETVS